MKKINRILILGHPRHKNNYETHKCIFNYLLDFERTVFIDASLANELTDLPADAFCDLEHNFPSDLDLILVVGGDGNMLRAVNSFADKGVPFIGVNKGNLGFLTDIDPENVKAAIKHVIIEENYYLEERDIFKTCILNKQNKVHNQYPVFNELAITGTINHRIVEMEVFIDKKFAFGMLGDGLLVSTPTGSTAYNLSASGPIVHPSVKALIINPLNAHTLTSRPIVVPGDSEIEIHFKGNSLINTASLYFDGQLADLSTVDTCVIFKPAKVSIMMLHSTDYSYYRLLAKKLGWSSRLF